MQVDVPTRFSNDEVLVEQALQDPAAFGSVVTQYYHMVFSVAYAYLHDPDAAEELAQETFLRAFLHLDKLREPRTLTAWLNRIARNESLKWIEKRQVRSRLMPTVPLEAVPVNLADEGQPSPGQQAEMKDEREGIRESLSRLPADNTSFVNLQLRTGLTLRARIIDSITSEPIPGAKVWSREKGGVSNTSGVLQIHGLSAGDKEFYFEKDGYARFWSENSPSRRFGRYEIETSGWHVDWDRMVFTVAENAQAVTIVAEKGARIRGTVLDPNQGPAGDIEVSMIHAGARSGLGSGEGIYNCRTDMSGRFELLLPASKSASFRLVACDRSKTQRHSRRRWADAQMDGLVTQPGQELDGIVLRLARPGTLRGQVVIPGGKPALAPRTRVAVQADWPGLQRCMWVPEATVDAEGRFELDFVPPGKSELRVVYWIPADNALAPKSVTPPAITLAEGETMTSVTLTVVAGAE